MRVEVLSRLGIQAVVIMCQDGITVEQRAAIRLVTQSGVLVLEHNARDDSEHQLLESATAAGVFRFVYSHLQADMSVLVVCWAGVNRSAGICAAAVTEFYGVALIQVGSLLNLMVCQGVETSETGSPWAPIPSCALQGS